MGTDEVEPPVHDMLVLKGTKTNVTMPLCELMDGKFIGLEEGSVIMEQGEKRFTLKRCEFVKAIEENLAYLGKVKSLSIWREGEFQPEEIN